MEGNWERYGVGFLKWAVVPLVVFGIGLFIIGPRLTGDPDVTAEADAVTEQAAEANTRPIEPGPRKWKPVAPPQVSISVERKEVPEFDQLEDSEAPPIEIPVEGEVDEAGVGGMTPPTTTGGDGGTDDATTGGDGGTVVFRGIGGR